MPQPPEAQRTTRWAGSVTHVDEFASGTLIPIVEVSLAVELSMHRQGLSVPSERSPWLSGPLTQGMTCGDMMVMGLEVARRSMVATGVRRAPFARPALGHVGRAHARRSGTRDDQLTTRTAVHNANTIRAVTRPLLPPFATSHPPLRHLRFRILRTLFILVRSTRWQSRGPADCGRCNTTLGG